MKTKKTKTATHNNTTSTLETINALPVIGETVNNWRQRRITLRSHPTDPARLISVGATFDGSMVVIADDARKDWATALDYASRGKVYTSN